MVLNPTKYILPSSAPASDQQPTVSDIYGPADITSLIGEVSNNSTTLDDLLELLDALDSYGELYRGTNGSQNVTGSGTILDWDAAGQSQNVTVDTANNRLIALFAKDYNCVFQGYVAIEKEIEYEINLLKNGSLFRELGTMIIKDDSPDFGTISAGCIVPLAVNDYVEIQVDPVGGNKQFDMRTGARFMINGV